MKDVIILAAGVGSRLRPLTDKIPKTMVSVKGDTIINRLLRQIQCSSQDCKTHVVVGYRYKQIDQHLKEQGHSCQLVVNENYATTNNMYSLHLAMSEIEDSNGLVIINADCVYDEEIVHAMLETEHSKIAVDTTNFFDESMKVEVKDQAIRGISKKYQNKPDTCVSIDIYSFDAVHKRKLNDIVSKTIESGELNHWTEVAIDTLVHDLSTQVTTFDIGNKKWVEIDDHSDLAKANSLM